LSYEYAKLYIADLEVNSVTKPITMPVVQTK